MTGSVSVVDRATIPDVLRLAAIPYNVRNGMFLCPCHPDEHPSAHVAPSRRGWVCFACDAHGGVLDLAVAVGLADSRADAAAYLEAHLR